MKQFYFLFIITTLSVSSVDAQGFKGGVLLGVCGSQIDGDEQYKYKKPGLVFGAFVLKPFSDKSGLKIETYYIGKGAVLNIDYPDGSSFQEFNTSLHYIEMPFLYNFYIHPKIELSIGIAPSYLFAHKLTRQKIEIDKSLYSISSFDIQPMGQVGFYLTDHISSSIRISYSALDIRQEEDWYNNNLSVALKYMF